MLQEIISCVLLHKVHHLKDSKESNFGDCLFYLRKIAFNIN